MKSGWLIVGLVAGALLGVELEKGSHWDSFSHATKAFCDGTQCEDKYLLQCNDMRYTLPTGFKIEIPAFPEAPGENQKASIEE